MGNGFSYGGCERFEEPVEFPDPQKQLEFEGLMSEKKRDVKRLSKKIEEQQFEESGNLCFQNKLTPKNHLSGPFGEIVYGDMGWYKLRGPTVKCPNCRKEVRVLEDLRKNRQWSKMYELIQGFRSELDKMKPKLKRCKSHGKETQFFCYSCPKFVGNEDCLQGERHMNHHIEEISLMHIQTIKAAEYQKSRVDNALKYLNQFRPCNLESFCLEDLEGTKETILDMIREKLDDKIKEIKDGYVENENRNTKIQKIKDALEINRRETGQMLALPPNEENILRMQPTVKSGFEKVKEAGDIDFKENSVDSQIDEQLGEERRSTFAFDFGIFQARYHKNAMLDLVKEAAESFKDIE